MQLKPTFATRALPGILARGLNRALRSRGLRLDYLQKDFDDRPIDDYTCGRVLSAMGAAYQSWVVSQHFVNVAESFDPKAATAEFFERWLDTPFRGQQGGSRFNNLLWLHLIARSWRPDCIIDSGTFQGASAWALSLGSPGSKVLSFDIDLSHLALKAPGVSYIESDWTRGTLDVDAGAKVLAYFDDHIDQIRRLIEAADRGCQIAIFDDDFPVTSFYGMAPSPHVLPKVEFALDDDLQDGQILHWISNGAPQSFTVDRGYLDRGRARIAMTERLPNTSLVTGIHQTPYRIVLLKQGERAAT